MLNIGKINPGSTIDIPFHTFDSNDPSGSVTITGFAVTDIEVYKDGNTTQRASDSGYTLLDTDGVDFDGIVGAHGFSIDLSDNTTVGFYEAGSTYMVAVAGIVVDAADPVNFWAARFTIGYEGALLDTTIATLASQISFTLEEGSADDDAYNNYMAYVHDLASAVQVCIGYVDDYTGSTKTITLKADPSIFTMAAGDNVSLFPPSNIAAISASVAAADNMKVLFDSNEGFYSAYAGPRGPGIYLNDAAGNTNIVNGADGTIGNPVSTIAAAKSLADSMSLDRIYLVNDTDITLAATMVNYEFIGIGEITTNIINLGSQDASASSFFNVCIEGTQGGSGRISAEDCALRDPGAGATTLHIFAKHCGIVDDIEVDTSNDNVFENWYSLVAGSGTPKITATGAAGTISLRHGSGGIELGALSASHNVSVETDGQVIFTADCNVNANVSLRGNMTITDNTAGMASLTVEAALNRAAINAEADTAISDASLATAAALATAQADLDIITDSDGVVIGAVGVALIARAILPQQNVAEPDIPFVFVAASDHVTPVTAASGIVVNRAIDGAAEAVGTSTVAEVAGGGYTFDASAADINGKQIIFRITASGGTPGAPDDSFIIVTTAA